MSGPSTVACLTVSPTFSTTLDDLRREDPSAPMITDHESALFASYQLSSTDIDTDMPSPLSDSDLAQIINIEGASWAVDLRGVSYRSRLSSPRTSPPQVVDPSAPVLQKFDLILGVPPIYHKLTDAGAPFWASVVLDLRKLLWANMSQRLIGREPTKSLFTELNGKAVTRQASTWDPGSCTKICDTPSKLIFSSPSQPRHTKDRACRNVEGKYDRRRFPNQGIASHCQTGCVHLAGGHQIHACDYARG